MRHTSISWAEFAPAPNMNCTAVPDPKPGGCAAIPNAAFTAHFHALGRTEILNFKELRARIDRAIAGEPAENLLGAVG